MTTQSTLPLVVEQDMLPAQDYIDLQVLGEELSEVYKTRQIFRTETEARISVLNDLHFPTKASKYWQACREQGVMLEQLAMGSFEFRRNEVQIRRIKAQLEDEKLDEFAREELLISLDEAMFKKAAMASTSADRVRELKMWSKLKSEVNDGSFDTVSVNTHQLVSYTAQFAIRAANMKEASMTGGEYDNLIGQLQTSINRCIALGVMSELRAMIPASVCTKLKLPN